ncbi:MAG: hypothetical protein WCA17_09710 [Burkholderiales bacterium]
MPVWKRLWLLFTVIWVVVGVLRIVTYAVFGEPGIGQFVQPVILMIAVPAVVYVPLWVWARQRARRKGEG